MRPTVTFLLGILVAIAFVASLVSFALWLVFAYNTVTGHSVAEFGAAFAPEMMEQASRSELLVMQVREYVALIGGAIGWAAFFTLPHYSGRPFRALPRLLIVSCAIGIIAAVVMAAPLVFKIAPILTVLLVFLRCALIEPRPDEVGEQRGVET